MNINKFTQKSIEAVNQCEKIAYDHGHQEIDQEHFLYSLLTIDDSLIASLLEKMGINKETFLSQVQELLNKKPKVSGGQVYMSNDLNQVLLHGEDEMKAMKDEYVSVEHLFLAMIKHPNKAVKELFRAYGITRDRFLQVLSQIRGGQKVTSDNPEETYDSLEKYGYDLVKSGRFNKRKHEVFELAINEAEAAVVRIIFDKYVHEGFGAQRIATYLNNLGYRARTGKMWHHASIRGIICNLTYTGVLRSGESRSQTLPHLQIITPELFEAAQHIRTSRANSAEQERRVPLNTRGQSLLAGNVFCGHCGSRLALTTNGKAYPCKEDAHRIVKRVRYICYGKTRKQTECDGQTGYTAHILDGVIDKVVRQIFERMKAIPKSEIVNIRYREKMEERKALLKSAKSDYAKAAAELDTLRGEVIKALRGESAFSQELLSSLIADGEKKCLTIQHTMEAAQAAYDEGQVMLDALNAQYDDIISWADMYDSASMESKKMIVSCLIRRVEVYRDYRLHIDFNIDFEQFSAGLDISAIAA